MSENKSKEYDPSKAPFSWDKLDGLLAYKANCVICAEILECHVNSIKNHIRKRYDMTFTEYAEKKLSRTRMKLIQQAIQQATSGNTTMLIFCLKNLCGWTDKVEQNAKLTKEIKIELADKADEQV